ncbi:MAG: 50S ribosomal protein L18 [Deltaproteobacteria bacterium]|nr:50S ribosomal protein L18 [Deltaproteobacteria bacterium]
MEGRIVKLNGLQRRKIRVRKKVKGTTERPRLSVFRSNKNIYAQVIDDTAGKTLAAVSTRSKAYAEAAGKDSKKVGAAKLVGKLIAKIALEKGVTKVVFDRSGYIYHGRVTALAEGAREGGLQF